MSNREILKEIYILREKAERNKLAVFVGAGVSRNVPGMPSWYELVVAMAKEIGYSKCDVCRHKKDCQKRCEKCSQRDECGSKCFAAADYSADEYLKIPQYVFNQKQQTYMEVVKKNITDKSISDAPLSKAVFEIHPAHIITTNYDRLLEASDSEFRRQYDVVISDGDLLDSDKSKYIIKMHGDVTRPDTIVLKEQDYLEYSQKHVLIELFIKALLADHTILFLGYSLNDYNVKLIISWLNFLRSQNKTIKKERRIGYIVLDEEKVDKNTKDYFRSNNIEVLNIHTLPQIKDIPAELAEDKGKRLYSFLRIIQDPFLEEGVSSQMSMESAINFLDKHKTFDYSILLKYLHISSYSKVDSTLQIRDKREYDRLTGFLSTRSEASQKLAQMLKNVGITTFEHHDYGDYQQYTIDSAISSELLSDRFFSLYIQNKYEELLSICQLDSGDILKKSFYRHFITGYQGIPDAYSKICFENLCESERVIYLHNNATLDSFKQYRFNSVSVQNYISNIALSSERQLFQPFLDLYEGNSSKRMQMTESLAKLRDNIQAIQYSFFSKGALSELYSIKNLAIAQYYFYFTRYLFTLGFDDAKKFFRPYVEAIICANGDDVERPSKLLGFEMKNQKYALSAIDCDILTKYISVKDLFNLLSSCRITSFCFGPNILDHIVSCFINLVDSIVSCESFGYYGSSIVALTNLVQLLDKSVLSDTETERITKAIHKLLSNKRFNAFFWNTSCPDFKYCTRVFASFTKRIKPYTNINCVEAILDSPDFFDFVINSSFNATREIINSFLKEDESDNFKEKLYDYIDREQVLSRKVLLMRLFFRILPADEKTKEYRAYLSENFSKLDKEAIYDFVFADWISPTDQDINNLLSEILSLYRNRTPGVGVSSDPLEQKMECMYLLHITGKINDISILDEMCGDYPHLQFLLHPTEFNYQKIDFSNYMWENIARRKKYMDIIVEHKYAYIDKLKDRVRRKEASDIEMKILYGYFMKGEDIWK